MGNAACSCCWWRGAKDDRKKTDGDGKDGDSSWLKQGSVPLVTARYDDDDGGDEGVVKKAVVMRSPRPAGGSAFAVAPIPTILSSGGSTSPTARARHDTGGSRGSPSSHPLSSSPRHHSSASSPRRKKGRAAGLRPVGPSSDDEVKPSALTADDEVESKERESAGSKDVDDSSLGGESLDATSQSSARHSDQESHNRHHHREESSDQQDEENVGQQGEEEAPRSPRSTRSASHDSTGSGSGRKKPRYGRKNYRANSGRKKTH